MKLLLGLILLLLVSCEGGRRVPAPGPGPVVARDGGARDSGPDGGAPDAGLDGGSKTERTGTCASICAKSIALMCASPPPPQAECETNCSVQKRECEGRGMGAVYRTFLDCIESTALHCGESSMAPTSPHCANEALALLSCAT